MAQSIQPGRFGHSGKPDDAWLAKQEKERILEPELPIIDTHHHLWDRGGWTYLLTELLADLNTGHNIVATVFEECRSMYRVHGPVEMRPVGEVEFVAGIAAMSASGGYGPIKVAQGIVGFADLALGDRVEPVLEVLIRAGGGRLRCRPDHRQQPVGLSAPYARPARSPRRGGAARRARAGARCLVLPSATRQCHRSGAGRAAGDDRDVPRRRRAWLRRLCRQEGRSSRRLASQHGGVGHVPERLRQTRRHAEPRRRAQFPRASGAAEFGGLGGGLAPLCRTLYRVVWCRTLQFREQLPRGQDGDRLCDAVERVQAHHLRMLTDREARSLQRHSEAALPSRLRRAAANSLMPPRTVARG